MLGEEEKRRRIENEENMERKKRERDKNGIRVRTVSNSFLCVSSRLALFLLREFWREYKKTKKKKKRDRMEWKKRIIIIRREDCWMWISDACATFPIYTRSPGIKSERRRRRRSWCGGSGGRRPFSFAASFAYHLAIATLLLCASAGWLARSAESKNQRPHGTESRRIRFGQSAPKEHERMEQATHRKGERRRSG